VNFRFKTKSLESLYQELKDAHKYPEKVVEGFFEVMSIIAGATDERDLYANKSLHYEKLRGSRSDERSLRLNKQWRLIVTLEIDDQGKNMLIIKIENHYE
jgi:proteic killer suppression protein